MAALYGGGVDRSDLSSWLSGPRAAADASGIAIGFPGERLGLPRTGIGSVTGWVRRFVALFIDGFLATATVRLLFPGFEPSGGPYTLAVIGTFVVQVTLLTSLLQGSFGQLVLGIRLIPVGATQRWPLRMVVRALLVALVLPALLYDRDRRGLPDYAAKTVLVRFR
jgi:uncharacterized RDD family membrane protein YckC